MVGLCHEQISIIDFDDDDSGTNQSKISNKSPIGEKKPAGGGINAFD